MSRGLARGGRAAIALLLLVLLAQVAACGPLAAELPSHPADASIGVPLGEGHDHDLQCTTGDDDPYSSPARSAARDAGNATTWAPDIGQAVVLPGPDTTLSGGVDPPRLQPRACSGRALLISVMVSRS